MIERRRGRPELPDAERKKPVTTRIPEPVYKELCQIAREQGVSVTRVLRYAAIRLVRLRREATGEVARL